MGTLSKGDLVPLNNATKFFSGAKRNSWRPQQRVVI